MKRKLLLTTLTISIVAILALASHLYGQMSHDRLRKLLEERVAIQPGELPYVERQGIGTGVLEDVNAPYLTQSLRFNRRGPLGNFLAEISYVLALVSDERQAYRKSVFFAGSQLAPLGTPGIPEGTYSCFPIGMKSWVYTPPEGAKPGPGAGTARLVIHDGCLTLKVYVEYQPIDPKAKTGVFLPVTREDQERSEFVARLLLSRAHMLLMNWEGLGTLRVQSAKATVPAKRSTAGVIYIAAGAVLQQHGGSLKQGKAGVFTASWLGKRVTIPVAARVLLIGKQQVPLSQPVLYDGREVWIEARGFAQAFGWKLIRRGQAVSLSPQ